MTDLFALPVEVRRCRRNRRRLVVVSAEARRLAPWRYGLSAVRLEAP